MEMQQAHILPVMFFINNVSSINSHNVALSTTEGRNLPRELLSNSIKSLQAQRRWSGQLRAHTKVTMVGQKNQSSMEERKAKQKT
jgi:hypothetical protein